MLRASSLTTLRRVLLPLLKPALLTALVAALVAALMAALVAALVAALAYSVAHSMTTAPAVIFLVTADYELATTHIIGRVGNGDCDVALACSTVLIVLMSLVTAAT